MKRFLLFLFCMPLASPAQIRVSSNDEKLNGEVKKMMQYEYSLFPDSNQYRVPNQTAIYTYDEETKQENVYYYSGSDSTRYVFRDIFKFSGNKLTEHRHISKAGAHGRCIKGDSTYSIVTYKYDGSDRLIEINTSESSFDSKTNYIYDGEGNVTEMNKYMNVVCLDGSPYKGIKTKFKYDNKGHVVWEDIYDNMLTYHVTYKYDSNYHYSEKHTIDMTCNREWKTIRRYDDGMNIIEEVSYYKSDDTNRKFQEQGPHIKNDYKYDDKGNWVEQTNYQDGQMSHYIKREILY